MKAVPLGSQHTVEFTASLPFSQHSLISISPRLPLPYTRQLRHDGQQLIDANHLFTAPGAAENSSTGVWLQESQVGVCENFCCPITQPNETPLASLSGHNHPFCSASRAASIRLRAPSFCMATER
jgi:hypothetical protein